MTKSEEMWADLRQKLCLEWDMNNLYKDGEYTGISFIYNQKHINNIYWCWSIGSQRYYNFDLFANDAIKFFSE